MPLADTPRARAQAELMDHNRVSALQNLDIADARVRDVRMDAVGTMPGRAGPRSARDRLIAM
jgi:hypothetical protein